MGAAEAANTVFAGYQKECSVERNTLYTANCRATAPLKKIAEISVHYHIINGGACGGCPVHPYYLKSIDIENIDIIVYDSFHIHHYIVQWAAAP
jgi:hypothetical protein